SASPSRPARISSGAPWSPRPRAACRSRRDRRRIAGTVAVAVVAGPGAAIAPEPLLPPAQGAPSLSSGTLALLGTHPSCTTVQDGVEYHCALESVPTDQGGPPAPPCVDPAEPS